MPTSSRGRAAKGRPLLDGRCAVGEDRVMTARFRHESHAQRVIFGAGAARTEIAGEVARLGATRVLVIASAGQRDLAAELTADLPVSAVFTGVRPHVPTDIAAAARHAAEASRADLLLCVGGGSTTGTAKAVALTSGLPILAVPTTYAGSEATPVWGLTERGHKTTGTDEIVLPRVVVYDPELTLSLPPALTVASGLNAMAHCVDSLWAPNANPVATALATAGIRALATGLPAVRKDGADVAARGDTLAAAYLSAVAFAGAGSGLHHKICHILGGAFDLPHAATHAVVLPYVAAFNVPAAPAAGDALASALGVPDAVPGLRELYDGLDAPACLRDLGMPESGIAAAAGQVADAAPATNPRPVTRDDAETLLRQAWTGERR
jgi:alcohol dehydrogenase class IV